MKALKSLTVFCALLLSIGSLFYSPSQSLSSDLPDCSTLANGVAANPGVNCLYNGLPICTSTLNAASTVSSPNHRVNCADLMDMPLCTDVTSAGGSALSTKNCALECSAIATDDDATKIRGIDYAAHNRDCIRFCDAIEAGVPSITSQLSNEKKCVVRGCHQQATGYTTSGGDPTCNLLKCKVLSTYELNQAKYDDDSIKYCDGSDKCYDFEAAKLAFLRVRAKNPTCKVHDCKPSAGASCPDDTLNVTNKVEIYNGNSYETEYVRTINFTYPLSDSINSLCTEGLSCKPTIPRSYACTGSDSTIRNALCDPAGTDGGTCTSGTCYYSVDCNDAANASAVECAVADTEAPLADDTQSWFYKPAPKSKAINSNGTFNTTKMSSNLCYSDDNMKDHGWGSQSPVINMGLFTIPSFYSHSYISPDKSRSPGHCSAGRDGGRGAGYIYLCGNHGILDRMVSDDVGYYSGYINTDFYANGADYKLSVCLRFKNSMRPDDAGKDDSESCGRRECGISCAFDACDHQACGSDVCRTLTVEETASNPGTLCEMDDGLFENSGSNRECLSVIDTYLRLRAVKYGNRICAFLDVKGQTAHSIKFLDENEKLDDGTCVSGTTVTGGCSGGKDSNDNKTEADKWRAIKRIHYIDDVIKTSTKKGYYKYDGQYVKALQCMKTPLRISAKKFYNLATAQNSITMFSPPLYILNSRVAKDGSISVSPSTSAESFGPTDFNYPEIEVRFGSTSQKLSLTIDKTGYEIDSSAKDTNGSAVLSTTVNGSPYTATVFVRKEFNIDTLVPSFCLYRTIVDSKGVSQDIQLECVTRKFPEINNITPATLTADMRKVVLSSPTSPVNKYDSSSIIIKYQGKGSEYSTAITLSNPVWETISCNREVEQYQICAQRELCNRLNNECVTNDINIQNAASDSQRNQYASFKEYCYGTLKENCDLRKGIINGSSVYSNTYGWYNELCISNPSDSSIHPFATKLNNVIAYKVKDSDGNQIYNVMGKCKIDSYNSAGDCSAGGNAPNCLCVEAPDGYLPADDEVIRAKTPREAGLCIDIPVSNSCPAIAYDTAAARTAGSNTGHAEFPITVAGMSNLEGTCNGYWKAQSPLLTPKMSCLRNSDDSASWNYSVSNACIRYSCPSIYTADPIYTAGVPRYQDGYVVSSETTDLTRGESNGNALWDMHLQTSDNVETATAYYCNSGFKKSGSTPHYNGTYVAGFNTIDRYDGGIFPNRTCSQLGVWGATITNKCERIACPAINPTDPRTLTEGSAAWTSAWAAWNTAGGASYNTVNASRTSDSKKIPAESIATGDCNEALGYYQVSGGALPTRTCDYLGNWGQVVNACVTRCNAISTSEIASTANNGFAYWVQAETAIGSDIDGVLDTALSSLYGCVSGYVPYPYPPVKDKYGLPLSTDVQNDLTRSTTVPQRVCKVVAVEGGLTANIWTGTSSSCVNKCPGGATDSRIGVGITQHTLGDGSTLNITWDDESPGVIQVKSGQASSGASTFVATGSQLVTNFSSSTRTNGYYIVARRCGDDYKWVKYNSDGVETVGGTEFVQPKCASNAAGTTENITGTQAIFSSASSYVNEDAVLTGSCVSTYGSDNPPQYKCQQKDSNRKIDQFYYAKTAGNDSCLKICAAANTITNGTDFTTYSEYVGSTISSIKYAGDTVNLSCIDGNGYNKGSGTVSDADHKCGRAQSTRIDTAPVATCGTNGQWTVGNDCDVCDGCTNASSVSNSTTGISESNDCNSYGTTAEALMDECQNNSVAVNASNGSYASIGHYKDRKCKNKNNVCHDRDVCAAGKYICNDGVYTYTQNLGGDNSCGGVTRCGSSSQSCGG